MKNIIQQVLISTLFLLFCGLSVSSEKSIAQADLLEIVTGEICDKRRYMECLKLSRSQCIAAFKKSIASCPYTSSGERI